MRANALASNATFDMTLLAGRRDYGTSKEYENRIVEYERSTEELYTCLMVISKLR